MEKERTGKGTGPWGDTASQGGNGWHISTTEHTSGWGQNLSYRPPERSGGKKHSCWRDTICKVNSASARQKKGITWGCVE